MEDLGTKAYRPSPNCPYAVVVCPTRELAHQSYEQGIKLCECMFSVILPLVMIIL